MKYFSYTNDGSREVNEDFFGVSTYDDSVCFVVADGLGGHGGGDIASRCAVSEVSRIFMKNGFSNHFFDDAFSAVQKSILEKQAESVSWDRMKTTLVIAVVADGYIYYSHVGDSRFYYFKKGRYILHSKDHSVPQMLVLSGEIKEEEIRFHPDRNRLIKVMGIRGEFPKFSVGKKIKLVGKQAFLLCTDGFWEMLSEKEMSECLEKSRDSEEWTNFMCKYISENGKDANMDNYTCIAIISEKKSLFGGFK